MGQTTVLRSSFFIALSIIVLSGCKTTRVVLRRDVALDYVAATYKPVSKWYEYHTDKRVDTMYQYVIVKRRKF